MDLGWATVCSSRHTLTRGPKVDADRLNEASPQVRRVTHTHTARYNNKGWANRSRCTADQHHHVDSAPCTLLDDHGATCIDADPMRVSAQCERKAASREATRCTGMRRVLGRRRARARAKRTRLQRLHPHPGEPAGALVGAIRSFATPVGSAFELVAARRLTVGSGPRLHPAQQDSCARSAPSVTPPNTRAARRGTTHAGARTGPAPLETPWQSRTCCCSQLHERSAGSVALATSAVSSACAVGASPGA
eukprot:5777426-Prymnesium_polylepis.2